MENIKLTYVIFRNEQFLSAVNVFFGQSFGGKVDAVAMKVVREIMQAQKDFDSCRDKSIKENGVALNGGFTMKGATEAGIKAFIEYMEDLYAHEITLPISEKLQLVKRKANKFSPIDAAIIEPIAEVVWPKDDGSSLDSE